MAAYVRGPYICWAALEAVSYSALILRIEGEQACACFSCGKTFMAKVGNGPLHQYAGGISCPHCHEYTVLPESAGFPFTQAFLGALRDFKEAYRKGKLLYGTSRQTE